MLLFRLVLLPVLVAGHGAMVTPRSRNSIDWEEGPLHGPMLGGTTWAWCQNITGNKCNNGQTAYWYSQGCFIGCAKCDHMSGRRQTDLCNKGFIGELPDYAISVNRAVERDSKYDIYRHNPWRAPGHAPVADACGLAGGTPWTHTSPEEGWYINTTHAYHGMKGSELPEMPTGTVWKAGGEAPVVWQVRFNHGGGYSYRLCPASEPLTEECFQALPLDFVEDKQALLFANGSKLPIAGVFTTTGTSPLNSTWARLPIPSGGLGPRCSCNMDTHYHPGDFSCGCNMGEQADGCHTPGNCSSGACEPCPETAGSDCSRCANPPKDGQMFPTAYDHALSERPAVYDMVKVPMVPPGKYVVGFRYDCDATAQVWSNCADITIA